MRYIFFFTASIMIMLLLLLTSTVITTSAWSQHQQPLSSSIKTNSIPTTTRRSFLPTIVASVITTSSLVLLGPSVMHRGSNGNVAVAAEIDASTTETATSTTQGDKLNLSDDELIRIIRDDIVQRQFLVTGNVTRSIYSPSATFTDEIDSYKMDQWMIGTQRLFVGPPNSSVRLVNDEITIPSPNTIEFRFDEDLMFNLPIVKPIISLTGKVVLIRDPITGYIISYREYWDQDVATALKSIKF